MMSFCQELAKHAEIIARVSLLSQQEGFPVFKKQVEMIKYTFKMIEGPRGRIGMKGKNKT